MSHSIPLIFQEEKSRQASESDLSIWRSRAMDFFFPWRYCRVADRAPIILFDTRTVSHIPYRSLTIPS